MAKKTKQEQAINDVLQYVFEFEVEDFIDQLREGNNYTAHVYYRALVAKYGSKRAKVEVESFRKEYDAYGND